MTICFERPHGDLLIKSGQKVDFSTPLFAAAGLETVTINVAAHLGIAPSAIFLSVKKVVGDSVTAGEVLASKKTLLADKKFVSPQTGIVREINHEDGNVTIEVSQESPETVKCFFAGYVDKITAGEICLRVEGARQFALAAADHTFGGQVAFFSEEDAQGLTLEKVALHVIFIPSITPYEQAKIEALGASGFVTTSSLSTDEVPPKAVLKAKGDFAKIKSLRLTYCIIDKKSATLFLYK